MLTFVVKPITTVLMAFNSTFESLVKTAAMALAGFDTAGNDRQVASQGLRESAATTICPLFVLTR